MKQVTFSDGTSVPALGMGSWNIGDSAQNRAREIKSLQAGLDAGLRVIDTAEMYGNGRSETLVGEAIRGRRDDAFLVSKVLPSNATFDGTQRSCRASLARLGTDRLDLYLLHWRGEVSLGETIEAMETLRQEGKILRWGVSNFDTDDMVEMERDTTHCSANQILYNLEARGVEYDLLERDRNARIVTMAYSPLGQGGELLHSSLLNDIATQYETKSGAVTPAQIALAWSLRRPNILSIPKAASYTHLTENLLALDLVLDENDLTTLDRHFKPPKCKVPLVMI